MLYVSNNSNDNSNDNSNIDYKTRKYNEATIDLETFRKEYNFTDKEEIIHVFINMSLQSNAFINFGNDYQKFSGKKIRLYFHKLNSIDMICDVFVENKEIFNKITNIILYSDFDYHTRLRDVIDKYIINNNIHNYFIYY